MGTSGVFAAALVGALILQSPAAFPFSSAQAPSVVGYGGHLEPPGAAPSRPPRIDSAPDRQTRTGVTAADGVVPDGATLFDDDIAAVANLDPNLLGALRLAASAAADDGIGFVVNSGWRSPAYQQQLLREAVSQYGSEEEALRWVATPTTSAHVSGDAVDIGPPEAAAWLSTHGARYGLCQIYDNEPWHFELRPHAEADGCRPRYADPTEDPRMWQ